MLSRLKSNRSPSSIRSPSGGDFVSFQINCDIDTLNECPQFGFFCVKWKHANSKQSGYTKWVPVQQNSNKACWKHNFSFDVRIEVDSNTQMLQESVLQFSVRNSKSEQVKKDGNFKLKLFL